MIRRKVLAVKAAVTTVALVLAIAGSVVAQSREARSFLSVTFAVDGKRVSCPDLKVQLRFHGRDIVLKQSSQGFTVPAVFQRAEHGAGKVHVSVACSDYTLSFSDLDPSWVSPGRWEFGIAYPPYWIEDFGWTPAIEHGTWVSYLESECNGCDPGVFTTVSHPTPPQALITSLRREQPDASGERAREIAYALAVFGTEYQRNRDHLLQLLNTCLSRPSDSPEDDVCDSKLLSFVTNLYWRGDTELLEPLLQIADSRRDVIGELGYFYGDLLDRHTATALNGLRTLSIEKQRTVCGLAGGDDFSIDLPKFQRVAEHLRTAGTEVAVRCLQESERKAGRVAK